MTVTPLGPPIATEPDIARGAPDAAGFSGALGRALDAAGAALVRADRAETAFARGRGGLQEMVVERAQADVALALAVATASRVTTALGTILGMQI